jgi:hypothetical protein
VSVAIPKDKRRVEVGPVDPLENLGALGRVGYRPHQGLRNDLHAGRYLEWDRRAVLVKNDNVEIARNLAREHAGICQRERQKISVGDEIDDVGHSLISSVRMGAKYSRQVGVNDKFGKVNR